MKKIPLRWLALGAWFINPVPGKQIPASSLTVVHPGTALTQQPPSDNFADFYELVPIVLLQPKSKKLADKYGLDFQGNCYDCNLASFHLTKKTLSWINVCNKSDSWSDESYTYQPMPDGALFTVKRTQFRFIKVESVPVYELKLSGDKLTLKNKRFSKFYTTKEQLRKFKQHDCGEFDG